MIDRTKGSKASPSQSHRSAALSLTLFGNMAIDAGTGPLRIASRKSRALLAYLVLSDSIEESRERLVGLLWSETDESKARASLRQALSDIRDICARGGFAGLKADKQAIALYRARFRADVLDVLQAAASGVVHPRLLETKRLPESLLAGFDTLDPAFRTWLLARRQTLHDRIVRALEVHLRGAGAPALLADAASAILNLDPTHEEACRHLMRTRAAAGDVAGALRAYKELWDLLEAEYDVEPSRDTQELVVAIKQGQVPSGGSAPASPQAHAIAPVARPEPAGGQPALAQKYVMSVDAFDLSSIDAGKAYIINGFRHELIACLVRFREWYVRDRAQRAPELASRMQPALPQYHIEASALQSNQDAIKLILTLREAGSDVYVWSDRLQLSLGNWFESQQTIVRRIAMALNVHISAERITRLTRERDAALEVYDRWLRGQALFQNYSPTDWHRAVEIFQQVIRECPDFAPAYSSLVQLHNSVHLVHPGVYRASARQQEALELAKIAARLDPIDSRAQLCLGWAQAMGQHYDQAEVNLGLAHELNENDPWTVVSSALGFAFCGSLTRASDLAGQSLALSVMPTRAHWGFQATTRFMCSDYRGCIEAANRASDVIPNLPAWKAAALYHLGEHKEASAEYQHFLALAQSKWFGSERPSNDAVTRWFLHLFPIKQKQDWERLRDGIAGAGAAVHDISYQQW
jgi:DNA-binding SARP family transcriptional activator